MRQHILGFLCLALLTLQSAAQDTFSIVAVDSVTGEVGSAGASCLDNSQIAGGVLIISDVHPGVGAIHTQASWNPGNQSNAKTKMDAGDSPQAIVNFLIFNDVQGDATIRQYGVVDLDNTGSPRAAAYTGGNTFDYKNHIIGPYYTIQGNILLGQEILDSMESRFLNAEGSLACKLMAALQGANVPGADTRCTSEGVSSLSAFLRVARPGDTTGTFYMDLQVVETPFGVEPIDSLQQLFDAFMAPAPNFTHSDSLLTVDFVNTTPVSTSLVWNFGDGGGATAANPTHIFPSGGTYNVCLTATNECMTATFCDSITVTAPVGIEESPEPQRLNVYPNPSAGVFTVESDVSIAGALLTVFNAEGEEVVRMSNLTGNALTLNLTMLPKGIYVVRVSIDTDLLVSTLVFE